MNQFTQKTSVKNNFVICSTFSLSKKPLLCQLPKHPILFSNSQNGRNLVLLQKNVLNLLLTNCQRDFQDIRLENIENPPFEGIKQKVQYCDFAKCSKGASPKYEVVQVAEYFLLDRSSQEGASNVASNENLRNLKISGSHHIFFVLLVYSLLCTNITGVVSGFCYCPQSFSGGGLYF